MTLLSPINFSSIILLFFFNRMIVLIESFTDTQHIGKKMSLKIFRCGKIKIEIEIENPGFRWNWIRRARFILCHFELFYNIGRHFCTYGNAFRKMSSGNIFVRVSSHNVHTIKTVKAFQVQQQLVKIMS